MVRLLGRALIALATAATVGVGIAPAQAASAPASSVVSVRRPDVPVAVPRLVDVDFIQRRNTDRIVFNFRGGVPDDVNARLVRVVRDSDGDRVRLPGRAFIVLSFEEARTRNFDRDVIDTDLRDVQALRLVDDGRDEDVVRVALGLRQRGHNLRDVRVFERDDSIVVDVNRNRDDDDRRR